MTSSQRRRRSRKPSSFSASGCARPSPWARSSRRRGRWPGRSAGQIAWQPGQVVVELGAGTGAISQGLIDSGLPPEAMMMIELDRSLFEYLRERFPQMRVVNGDATRLVDILRQQGVERGRHGDLRHARWSTCRSRSSARSSSRASPRSRPGGCMLQYSYSPIAPIPAKKLGVDARLVKFVLRNLPPATVWRYRRLAASPAPWPG